VPVFMQTPPTRSPHSTTATLFRSFAACTAAFWPAGPEPITTRSYSRMSLRTIAARAAARNPRARR
jgi:hypothetical protein